MTIDNILAKFEKLFNIFCIYGLVSTGAFFMYSIIRSLGTIINNSTPLDAAFMFGIVSMAVGLVGGIVTDKIKQRRSASIAESG